MSSWQQLEKDISRWLSALASDGIAFRNSFQAIIGFPSDGFRSDGMLANDDILIAVEVEAGQTHPDTNTGKYWLLNIEHKSYKKIVLFHIYTPDFNSYGWRKKLAEFYIDKMRSEVPIDYILLDYRTAKNYKATLTEIKTLIGERVRQEFGKSA
jgi:hypothetical protein